MEARSLFAAVAPDGPVIAADPAPVDTVPPRVVGIRVIGGPFSATGLAITFSEPVDPVRAADPDNYLIGVRGAKDSKEGIGPWGSSAYDNNDYDREDRYHALVDIRSAEYHPETLTVNIYARDEFYPSVVMKAVKVLGRRTGITDLAGNRLDGDGDGRPGDSALFRFAKYFGKKVRYIDADGDKVRLKLNGGGRMLVLVQRNPHPKANSGTALVVWLIDGVTKRSALTGTVTPTSRGGDGRADIGAILRAGPA
ncbi:MAG TPA: hypothetical protein VF796_21115, partial [Humisphaera sp.]